LPRSRPPRCSASRAAAPDGWPPPARSIDPRPVVPLTLPVSATIRTAFPRHTLDGAEVRATRLDTVVRLALLLRRRGQGARALTLTPRFAGGSTWTKTRRLAEPSHHDDDLCTVAYRLMDAAGLQRGRLTGLTLIGEDLIDAGQVAQQISLDTPRSPSGCRSRRRPRPRHVRARHHRPGRRLPPRLMTRPRPTVRR
jgi:hypothetical protein